MKKSLKATVAGTIGGCLLLAACGGGDSGEGGGNGEAASVTMWVYPILPDEAANKSFWATKVADFKKTNPNIDVKVEVQPWAKRDEALATAIASNTGPDAVYLIPDQIPVYARSLEDVTKIVPEEALADLQDNAKAAATIDGKLLGAPIATSVTTLVCDKRAFKTAGVSTYPTTWDEFLALGPTFKAKGIDLTLMTIDPGSLNTSWYPLLWQAGGDVFAEGGKEPSFQGAQGVAALDFTKKLYDGGFVNKDYFLKSTPTEQSPVATGKVACTWGIPNAELMKFWGAENLEVRPPLTKEKSVSYGTVGSLSILRGADDKEATGKWVAFATNPANSKGLLSDGGLFSPRESTGSLYADDPVMASLEKLVPQMTVGTVNDKSRAVMGVLAPEIQQAILGKKSSQQALTDAATAATALLK